MQHDLKYLDKHLRRWHPTYYTYADRQQMDIHYRALTNEIDSAKTLSDFRSIVRRAVTKVGCGHMGVKMPKGTPTTDSLMLMPLQVYCIKNQLFVRAYSENDSLLTVGDEILSINQVKTDSIITRLAEIETSDGYNTTGKTAWMEQLFNVYHSLVFGIPDSYIIVKKDGQNIVSTVTITPRKFSSSITLFAHHRPDSTDLVIKGNGINLYKTATDSKTAIIDLKNFDGKGQCRSYRKMFRHIRENNIENLIVDLRDNGGGSVFKGNAFLSYFRKPLIFGPVFSRKPRFVALNPNFKTNFWERITPILFLGIPFQYPNRDGWNHYIPFVRKFRNHYSGRTYVITNGRSFSMAAYVASVLKHKENAFTVGEETGGSVYASRGMAGGYIRLPNSKLDVYINIYQLKYGKRTEDNGFGVLPDLPVDYSINERMRRIDKEMEVIKKAISE